MESILKQFIDFSYKSINEIGIQLHKPCLRKPVTQFSLLSLLNLVSTEIHVNIFLIPKKKLILLFYFANTPSSILEEFS